MIMARPRETPPKKRWPASTISFDEYWFDGPGPGGGSGAFWAGGGCDGATVVGGGNGCAMGGAFCAKAGPNIAPDAANPAAVSTIMAILKARLKLSFMASSPLNPLLMGSI